MFDGCCQLFEVLWIRPVKLEAEVTQVGESGPKCQGLKVTFHQSKVQLSPQMWGFRKGIARLPVYLIYCYLTKYAEFILSPEGFFFLKNLSSKCGSDLRTETPLFGAFFLAFFFSLWSESCEEVSGHLDSDWDETEIRAFSCSSSGSVMPRVMKAFYERSWKTHKAWEGTGKCFLFL